MKLTLFILITSLFLVDSYSQTVGDAVGKLGLSPLLFVDSQEVDLDTIEDIDPFDVAHVRIVTPKRARKILGDKGEDGAIYVTTIKKAKTVYWNYFSSKSPEYKKSVPDPIADTTVQYILRGKVLPKRHEGELYQIANKHFRGLKIIRKDELLSKYNIKDKDLGVVIRAKKVKNLKANKSK